MKNKIFGTIMMIMLTLPALVAIASPQLVPQDQIVDDEALTLQISEGTGFIGVALNIENTGETIVNDVIWNFRYKPAITGTGLLISTNAQSGLIDEIIPGETIAISFSPLNNEAKSPFGFGNIYMNASVTTTNGFMRTQQRAFNLGPFLLNYKQTYIDIMPDEAYNRLLNEEFDLVIDVVGLDIYNNGHLPGAVNYVWADGTLNSKIDDLDPSSTYLVYCHTDPPSTASAQALVDAGFETIYRLEGNYASWKNAGYPIET